MKVALYVVQVLLALVFVVTAGGTKPSRQGTVALDPAFYLKDATNDESR